MLIDVLFNSSNGALPLMMGKETTDEIFPEIVETGIYTSNCNVFTELVEDNIVSLEGYLETNNDISIGDFPIVPFLCDSIDQLKTLLPNDIINDIKKKFVIFVYPIEKYSFFGERPYSKIGPYLGELTLTAETLNEEPNVDKLYRVSVYVVL